MSTIAVRAAQALAEVEQANEALLDAEIAAAEAAQATLRTAAHDRVAASELGQWFPGVVWQVLDYLTDATLIRPAEEADGSQRFVVIDAAAGQPPRVELLTTAPARGRWRVSGVPVRSAADVGRVLARQAAA